MNTIDMLQDALAVEIMLQEKYNHHAVNISTPPDVRQLFIQMREAKMQNVTQLQQQIHQMMQQGQSQ
jgi:hypothetical protein